MWPMRSYAPQRPERAWRKGLHTDLATTTERDSAIHPALSPEPASYLNISHSTRQLAPSGPGSHRRANWNRIQPSQPSSTERCAGRDDRLPFPKVHGCCRNLARHRVVVPQQNPAAVVVTAFPGFLISRLLWSMFESNGERDGECLNRQTPE